MKKIKRIICVVIFTVMIVSFSSSAFADGDEKNVEIPVSAETTVAEINGKYACLFEASTGQLIATKNHTDTFAMGHLAKLMTVYLTARQIESGNINLKTEVIASPEANRQGGTQIWLDAGEKITVEDLLKSITIGNANDACYALSEALYKSETEYVRTANETAVSLGMKNTHFADVTGMNENTLTTAYDMAILAGKLTEYDYLKEYFCLWIDYVRNGKTELVNTNRLVRSYDGITGMKACYDETSKNSVVATVKRNGMTMICVVSGCEDTDLRFFDAKKLLDYGFSAYEIYTPEIPKKALKKIKVVKGAKKKVDVMLENLSPVLIKKGGKGNVTAVFERADSVTAPVKKGTQIGELRVVDNEGIVFQSKIVVKEDVSSMTVGLALKRLWLNLLNLE